MVPPERIELSSPAPEAGTLSTELQGHYAKRISRPRATQQLQCDWDQDGGIHKVKRDSLDSVLTFVY